MMQGNLMVVAKLCSLPQTFHVKESFLLDVSLMLVSLSASLSSCSFHERAVLQPTLVCFTIQGLFWDGAEAEKARSGGAADDEELRFFSRTFVATPRWTHIAPPSASRLTRCLCRGAGISVVNDMLLIASCGAEAKERYGAMLVEALAPKQEPAPAPAPMPTPAPLHALSIKAEPSAETNEAKTAR